MIKSTYIFHLGNPYIWKNSTYWFYCQTVCYLRNKLSRDLGSPNSRQLLQLQLFSQIFKILDPPFSLYCLVLFGFMNYVCFLTATSWIILRTTIFVLFRNLLMSETVGICPFDWWSLSFGSLFHCFRRSSGGEESFCRYPAEGLLELSI